MDVPTITVDELAQLIRGFQPSRTILTAIELDVFTQLDEDLAADQVAQRLRTDPRATTMLLDALVALGLLSKQDGRYKNTPVASRYLSDRSPESERQAWMHAVHLWENWSQLTACVRSGKPAPELASRYSQPEWREAFIAAMDRNARQRAPLVVEALKTQPIERLLDVGGGSAAYTIAFAQKYPHLQAEVLDRPEVLPLTQRYIERAGLSDRVRTLAGDLTRDRFPSGYDLVLVFSICHMLAPEQNQDLLRRCYKALRPGGRVAIQDFILNADKTGPVPAALFSLNMLVGTERGASYSEPEYRQWLQAAGFERIERIDLPGPTDLLVGFKPV